MQYVTTSETRVQGPMNLNQVLPAPPSQLGYYRDIAVVAFPVPSRERTEKRSLKPLTTSSGEEDPGDKLIDGDINTLVLLPPLKGKKTQHAQLEFKEPFTASVVEIVGGVNFPGCKGVILTSDDGQDFKNTRSFNFEEHNLGRIIVSLDAPVSARFWRVQFTSFAVMAIGPTVSATNIPLAEIKLSSRYQIPDFHAKAGFATKLAKNPKEGGTDTTGAIPISQVVDLSSKVDAKGRLIWAVPAGEWVIVRFGHTPTGATNRRSTEEGQGLECDKFSKEALEAHWNGFVQKLLDDIGPLAGKVYNQPMIDSYEVGGQNWSKNFREEFQKRRGYDLIKYLPILTCRVVQDADTTERFLWDLRRTISDLFAENYFGRFAELCRERGLLFTLEPYTGPYESVQCGAAADVVTGEFWVGRQPPDSVKVAASIAHVFGKTLVAAEAFTATPEVGKWQNDPYRLKQYGDMAFCAGINRYLFHRYAMQPWTNRWPGMTMGRWGFHFDRTQTWWKQGKAWIDYISRCQFLLQQGRAWQDVACFVGETSPVVIREDWPELPFGYDFDAVNKDVLRTAKVTNGRIVLASGASYAVLVLPTNDRSMTPEMVGILGRLVKSGATIVGPRPQRSPSLAQFPRCDEEVRKVAEEIWNRCNGQTVLENASGKGRVIWGKAIAEVLDSLRLKPDFEFASAAGDAESKLAYTHRTAGDAEIYFVSNQRQEFDSVDCTFRVSGRTPSLWHADTGTIEAAPVWSERDGRTKVRLNLDPSGSVFVIFQKAASQTYHLVSAPGNDSRTIKSGRGPVWDPRLEDDGSIVIKAWENGSIQLATVKGNSLRLEARGIPAEELVRGAWKLSFPAGWGAPASVQLGELASWTEHPEQGVRYFSGTATYEKEIQISDDRLKKGRELWLDLGSVKNMAEVSLNGQEFGVLWKPPFRVIITPAARVGGNKLVVKITNLWPNRLIGDEQLPPDWKLSEGWPDWLAQGKPSPNGRLTFYTWNHWKKDSPLIESGLIGPVTLRTAEIVSAN
jgi:hypothetical protein